MDTAPMILQRIDDRIGEEALNLLLRGFPTRSRSFWSDGLARARMMAAPDTGVPLGYLLRKGQQAVGIILTLASRRWLGDASKTVVNLSSWYIEPDARAAAPWMLMKLLGESGDIQTDLTPSPQVARILSAARFVKWSDGIVAMSWPQARLAPRSGARLAAVDEIPKGALDDEGRILLQDHAKLGCLSAGLFDGAAWQPLVFLRMRRRGIPCGHLIYARDKKVVISSRRAVSDFLFRHRLPLFTMDGDRADRPAECLFRSHTMSKYYRGDMPRETIDYAYSELTYFKMH